MSDVLEAVGLLGIAVAVGFLTANWAWGLLVLSVESVAYGVALGLRGER